MRLMSTALCLLIGSAAFAVDSVQVIATTPVCVEDVSVDPAIFTLSRTSGSGSLPVTIDIFGSALLGTDYKLPAGLTYASRAVTITNGGTYTAPPLVNFTPPASGTITTGTAVIGIGDTTVLAAGEYAASPTLRLSPNTPGQEASLIPILSYKTIYSLRTQLASANDLTGSLPAAGGQQATGSIVNNRLVISGRGFGYAIGEAVTFSIPDGTVVATGKAVFEIADVVIATSGSGYTGGEGQIQITRSPFDSAGPGGLLNPSGDPLDVASIDRAFTVVGVTIDNAGSGYVEAPPTVSFATTNGSGATAFVSTVRTSITIPDGQASLTLAAEPKSDSNIELAEEIQIALPDVGGGYGVSEPSSATGIIADDDMTVGWTTVDASAEEDLLGATPGESTYSYAASAKSGVTDNPFRFNRYVKMQLTTESVAALNTDFKLTYMYRHANQPLGRTMQNLRTTDSEIKNGWKIPPKTNPKIGANLIPYIRGSYGELSVGDIIQFGTNGGDLYTVAGLDASYVIISPSLRADVSENTLIRNNLDIGFNANGGIQGNVLPGESGFDTYNAIDYTITPLYDSLPEGAESLFLKLLTSNDYLLSDIQTQKAWVGDDDVRPSLDLTSNAARPSVQDGTITIGTAVITLNAPLPKEVVLPYSISGTAEAGIDYQTLSGSVTVPANATSATIQIVPLFTGTTGVESVTITLIDTQDYLLSGSFSGITNSSTTVNILDQAGTVSIAATDAVATEAELTDADPGRFTISIDRVGKNLVPAPPFPAVSVTYTITGSATSGSDYVVLSGTTTIPANSDSVILPLSVVDDVIVEATEDVTVTLISAAGYNVDPLKASASVQILDNEPIVQISSSGNLAEPVTNTTINVSYPGTKLNRSIVIPYTLSGTATTGADFAGLSGSFTIPAGANSASFPVSVIDDSIAEATESFTIKLTSGSSYSIDAVKGSVTVQVADDEPFVALGAAINGAEPATSATVLLQLIDALGAPLSSRVGPPISVSYEVAPGKTLPANAGTDYTAPSDTGIGSVTIPANQVSAVISVPVIDDAAAEGDEQLVITLKPTANYNLTGIAALNSASLLILDNESTLTVSLISDATEGQVIGGARISNRGGAVSADVSIRYGISGSARAGSDYQPLTGLATIKAGSDHVDLPVAPIDNGALDGARSVVFTLKSSISYVIGGTGTATVTILDDDASGGTPSPAATDGAAGGGSCGLGGGVALLGGAMLFFGSRLRRSGRSA